MVEMFNFDPHWLKNVITGDETWVYGYDPETKRHPSQWLEHGEPRFKKARIFKSKLKCLLITFFDVKGLVQYEFVPEDMRIKVRPGRPKSKPWYSRECYLAKKSAKASLTTFKETNTDVDRNIYVSNRKRYTTLINFNKKKYLQEKQELLKNARDSANFWKTIATLKDKSYIQGNITILEWQCFYNKLLSAETTIGSDLSTLSRIDPELYCEISITEITREISSLANEKACGADEIPNEALKTLPFEHLVTLKNIFNRIINSGSYPLIWSKSIIHPIFKSGDRDNPSNYRGIALISNLSKLFTSILKSRLRNWIEGRSIIPENQAGFRKGYSCQDHIFTLLSLIQLTLRRKRRKLYAFFVDLKKAFDTVPHSLLWSKLGELGLDFRFVNLIRNYFEQMTTTATTQTWPKILSRRPTRSPALMMKIRVIGCSRASPVEKRGKPWLDIYD
ncbi:hypothetical protein LAZ67_3001738 [Cordylochernes scorpioides]|uniref:Reverse transcriptase domain-containing protein n=1 Tax=Cordylochernes scorpioides TaxID=51811 RepID=A0ABY6KAI0_9ARAC|nr:hypothetical protein LAZ67_3001738 [Cordylochernes scorpioides]